MGYGLGKSSMDERVKIHFTGVMIGPNPIYIFSKDFLIFFSFNFSDLALLFRDY